MTSSEKTGFRYQADRAEPGEEIVLGKSYGGAKGRLEDIRAALNDLAIHPTTAEHLSRKLAIHFVSDTPTEALIQAMKTRYLDTGGHLAETYEAMLNHPDAWVREGANFKRPLAFLMSSLRALGVPEKDMMAWKPKHFQTHLTRPMTRMGQSWLAPMGPDGWAETDSHWMSPQGVAARLQWAMATPSFMMDTLPDPRTFLVDALGPEAPEDVVFAAQAAESRNVGVALVLMSPAFQRHGV